VNKLLGGLVAVGIVLVMVRVAWKLNHDDIMEI
jgi:hypothetical protein